MKQKKDHAKETTSGDDLRRFRLEHLRFSLADTSRLLRIPVRTLEDYEAGRRAVPGVVTVAMILLQERQQQVTREIIEHLNAEVDRQFPGGIPSVTDEDQEGE